MLPLLACSLAALSALSALSAPPPPPAARRTDLDYAGKVAELSFQSGGGYHLKVFVTNSDTRTLLLGYGADPALTLDGKPVTALEVAAALAVGYGLDAKGTYLENSYGVYKAVAFTTASVPAVKKPLAGVAAVPPPAAGCRPTAPAPAVSRRPIGCRR